MKKFIVFILSIMCTLLLFTGCDSSKNKQEVSAYATTFDDVVKKGKLIIGLDDTFAPMGFRDEKNNLVGFDIDLANAVCKELGINAEFQPINWDAKEMELESGNIDCIWNGMSITPDREKSMSLSNPYLNNKIIIMTNTGVKIVTKDDLIGKEIGVQAGSAALEAVKNDEIYDNIKDKLREYPTYDEVLLDMKSGRLECMIIDEVYGSYKNSKLDNIYGVAEPNFGDDLYVIGFRKNDVELTNNVNEAIKSIILSGEGTEISEKWFGKDIIIK